MKRRMAWQVKETVCWEDAVQKGLRGSALDLKEAEHWDLKRLGGYRRSAQRVKRVT